MFSKTKCFLILLFCLFAIFDGGAVFGQDSGQKQFFKVNVQLANPVTDAPYSYNGARVLIQDLNGFLIGDCYTSAGVCAVELPLGDYQALSMTPLFECASPGCPTQFKITNEDETILLKIGFVKLPMNLCLDPDGEDYSTKAAVTLYRANQTFYTGMVDTCLNSSIVREYICEGDNYNLKDIKCPTGSGCYQGACVQSCQNIFGIDDAQCVSQSALEMFQRACPSQKINEDKLKSGRFCNVLGGNYCVSCKPECEIDNDCWSFACPADNGPFCSDQKCACKPLPPKCSNCGIGILNVCDEKECAALGGGKCIFIDGLLDLSNKCLPENECLLYCSAQKTEPVCGYNGQEYANECAAKCAKVEYSKGPCRSVDCGALYGAGWWCGSYEDWNGQCYGSGNYKTLPNNQTCNHKGNAICITCGAKTIFTVATDEQKPMPGISVLLKPFSDILTGLGLTLSDSACSTDASGSCSTNLIPGANYTVGAMDPTLVYKCSNCGQTGFVARLDDIAHNLILEKTVPVVPPPVIQPTIPVVISFKITDEGLIPVLSAVVNVFVKQNEKYDSSATFSCQTNQNGECSVSLKTYDVYKYIIKAPTGYECFAEHCVGLEATAIASMVNYAYLKPIDVVSPKPPEPGPVAPPISKEIKVFAPNGGQVWRVGETQYIIWNSQGDIQKVDIKIKNVTKKLTKTIATDVASTKQQESFAWNIPSAIFDNNWFVGDEFKIEIVSAPNDLKAESDSSFKILNKEGTSLFSQLITANQLNEIKTQYAQVTIPKYAIKEDAKLWVTALPVSSPDVSSKITKLPEGQGIVGGQVFDISLKTLVTEQDIKTFDQPVKITIPYNPSLIKDPKKQKIYIFNETTGQWDGLDTTVDTTNKTLSAFTTHFCLVFIPTVQAAPIGNVTDPNNLATPKSNECEPLKEKEWCGPCAAGGVCNAGLECRCAQGTGSVCNGKSSDTVGQCQTVGQIEICPMTTHSSFECLINEVMKWILYFGLIIAPLMIVLGGGYILLSRGDPRMATTGRNIIQWALIGLAVILFAKAFVSIITSVLK